MGLTLPGAGLRAGIPVCTTVMVLGSVKFGESR